jgi:hypothetical protein
MTLACHKSLRRQNSLTGTADKNSCDSLERCVSDSLCLSLGGSALFFGRRRPLGNRSRVPVQWKVRKVLDQGHKSRPERPLSNSLRVGSALHIADSERPGHGR